MNSSSRDDEFICNKNDNIQEFSLPIEISRYQSMSSVRHNRDPHFQGIRSRKAKRVVNKSGERNVGYSHIPHKSWRFFKDFVNTLIDEQWRYVITVFFLSFFLCWIMFAILWYLIAYAHGDLKFDPKTGERLGDSTRPCVENAFNFVGFLLFSIETQVTIGYGSKYPNEECPEAIFLMVAQIVCGVAIEGAMVGIVYAKMIRPPRRSSSMQFSRKAVICQRDSKLCLVFRVCDSKENQAISSRVQAYWFEERRSPEGELLRNFQHSLPLENGGRVFLIFPVTICHIIDSSSPLYDLSAKDLLEKRFEIVVTLTGLSNLTGQMIQARTSYLPREIMWGSRFINMIRYDKPNEVYAIDFDRFDELMPIDTPLCSAKRLEEVQAELFADITSEHRAHDLNENIDKIDDNHDENNEYYILSPKLPMVEDYAVSIRFQNEYKIGEGSIGCLETRFSKEVCAEELMTRLIEHRRSLDTEQRDNNSYSTQV